MGRVSPARVLIVAAALLAGCAAKHQAPPLTVPELESGKLAVRAMAARPVGPVQPVVSDEPSGRTLAERAPIAPAE